MLNEHGSSYVTSFIMWRSKEALCEHLCETHSDLKIYSLIKKKRNERLLTATRFPSSMFMIRPKVSNYRINVKDNSLILGQSLTGRSTTVDRLGIPAVAETLCFNKILLKYIIIGYIILCFSLKRSFSVITV